MKVTKISSNSEHLWPWQGNPDNIREKVVVGDISTRSYKIERGNSKKGWMLSYPSTKVSLTYSENPQSLDGAYNDLTNISQQTGVNFLPEGSRQTAFFDSEDFAQEWEVQKVEKYNGNTVLYCTIPSDNKKEDRENLQELVDKMEDDDLISRNHITPCFRISKAFSSFDANEINYFFESFESRRPLRKFITTSLSGENTAYIATYKLR